MHDGDDWTEPARSALDDIDAAMRKRLPEAGAELVGALRSLVRLRDEISGQCDRAPDTESRLQAVNAILSVLTSVKYPIAGFHRERLQTARDALVRLIEAGSRVDKAEQAPS